MGEIVIKGGTLIDGTGAPPRELDLKIKNGKIQEIGDVRTGKAKVIEANDLTVMPGLIESIMTT